MIQGCFRAVLMKFPWCLKKPSRVLQKKFLVCFKEVLGVCGEHFKGVSGVF